MSETGSVYVMTNESMPGVVKVGMTTGNPETRAKELSITNVPKPFIVYSAVAVKNPLAVEAEAHTRLRTWRLDESREFFSVSPECAAQKVKRAAMDLNAYCEKAPCPNARRDFQYLKLSFNEYEHNRLSAAIAVADRGKLEFIRLAIKREIERVLA